MLRSVTILLAFTRASTRAFTRPVVQLCKPATRYRSFSLDGTEGENRTYPRRRA